MMMTMTFTSLVIEDTNFVNWNKCLVFSKSVFPVVLTSQNLSFPYSTVPEIRRYLADFPILKQNDLWTLSLTIEPREPKPSPKPSS